MMKFKKLLATAMAGTMMLGLVATATPATNTYAASTTTKTSASGETFAGARNTTNTISGGAITSSGPAISINIDYNTYTATLTSPSNDIYAFVNIYKSKKEEINWEGKSSASYSYKFTGKTVTIDLSFLKAKSLQGIEVYGDKTMTKNRSSITAQPAKLKSLKYENEKFTYKSGGANVDLSPLNIYEYRGEYGSKWTSLDEFNNIDHSSAGTTILVREKATLTAPAGPETKVKIKAASKGPKITVNYPKNEISLKASWEVSLDGTNYTSTFGGKTLTELKGKVTPQMIRDEFNKDKTAAFTVFVRTAEVTRNEKITPASSVTPLIIPKATELTPETTSLVTSGSAITDITVASDSNDNSKVTASFEAGSGRTPKAIYKFKATDATFEYQLVGGRNAKWTSITPDKDITITLTDSKQTLLLRKAGTKLNTQKGTVNAFPSEEISIEIPAKP